MTSLRQHTNRGHPALQYTAPVISTNTLQPFVQQLFHFTSAPIAAAHNKQAASVHSFLSTVAFASSVAQHGSEFFFTTLTQLWRLDGLLRPLVSIMGFDSHLAYGGCVGFYNIQRRWYCGGGCGAGLGKGSGRITLYELVSSYFFFVFFLAGRYA